MGGRIVPKPEERPITDRERVKIIGVMGLVYLLLVLGGATAAHLWL